MRPDELEDRVVAALRAEALIAPQRRPFIVGGLAGAAALLVLAAAGLFLLPPRMADPEGELYMLALHSGPSYRRGAEGARAAEYGRWARRHPAAILDGAELGPAAAVLGPPADRGSTLSGYFVVRVREPAEAVAIARTMPHLRYGGTIVIRRIGG
jgi:hypothetical protein